MNKTFVEDTSQGHEVATRTDLAHYCAMQFTLVIECDGVTEWYCTFTRRALLQQFSHPFMA